MKPDKVIEELHLKTYEYVQNQNSFVHLEKSSEKISHFTILLLR